MNEVFLYSGSHTDNNQRGSHSPSTRPQMSHCCTRWQGIHHGAMYRHSHRGASKCNDWREYRCANKRHAEPHEQAVCGRRMYSHGRICQTASDVCGSETQLARYCNELQVWPNLGAPPVAKLRPHGVALAKFIALRVAWNGLKDKFGQGGQEGRTTMMVAITCNM